MDSAERNQDRRHWFYGDRTVGLAERNSDEFPLGLLARSAPKGVKRLEFQDSITDSSTGERVARTLVISANVDTDLPTYLDIDVQKAMVALSHRANRYEFPERVEFTIYGLLKVMRKANATEHIRRVAKSLDNWNGVRFKYSHWWTGDSWDHPRAFVLLQDYDLSRRSLGARAPDTPQVFTWSRHFVESVRQSKYKPFDSDFYFSLKKPTTRRLFTFLDKRLATKSDFRKADLADFAQNKIGLAASRRVSQYPDKLREGYDELVSRGFLANVSDKKRFGSDGDYHFYCKRGRGEKNRSQVSVPLTLVVDSKEATELESELVSRGVKKGSRKKQSAWLVDKADEQVIRDNCERYDVLKAEGCEVTVGLLVESIANGEQIRIPKGKQTASQKRKHDELVRERDECKKAHELARKQWNQLTYRLVFKSFDALNVTHREGVLAAAVTNAKPFDQTRYEDEPEGSEARRKARSKILSDCFQHVQRQVRRSVELPTDLQAWYDAATALLEELKEQEEWRVLQASHEALDAAKAALDRSHSGSA